MRGSKNDVFERQEAIKSYLNTHGTASTEALADKFKISLVTVRRDLEVLAQKGVVIRTHGGARLNLMSDSASYTEKEQIANESKRRIAEYIASVVPDGMTIFCNSGTTVYAVMEKLASKNVTIVTNNTKRLNSANGDLVCKLIGTGGAYNYKTESFIGNYATKVIQEISADMCILGAGGISADYGTSTNDFGQTMVNGAMAANCKGKLIVAVDGRKVGKKLTFRSLLPEQIDMIVTDTSADPLELERLKELGIEIIQVDA